MPTNNTTPWYDRDVMDILKHVPKRALWLFKKTIPAIAGISLGILAIHGYDRVDENPIDEVTEAIETKIDDDDYTVLIQGNSGISRLWGKGLETHFVKGARNQYERVENGHQSHESSKDSTKSYGSSAEINKDYQQKRKTISTAIQKSNKIKSDIGGSD